MKSRLSAILAFSFIAAAPLSTTLVKAQVSVEAGGNGRTASARPHRVVRVPRGQAGLGVVPIEIFPDAAAKTIVVHPTIPFDIAERMHLARSPRKVGDVVRWLCDKPEASCVLDGAEERSFAPQLLPEIRLEAQGQAVTVFSLREGVRYDPSLIGTSSARMFESRHVCRPNQPTCDSFIPRTATMTTARPAPSAPPLAPAAPSAAPSMNPSAKGPPAQAGHLRDRPPPVDEGTLNLVFHWPFESDFKYLAVSDPCGTTYVVPFGSQVHVPAMLERGSACTGDARLLRIPYSGGTIQITGFHLDIPSADGYVSMSYLVKTPDFAQESHRVPMLLPDIGGESFRVDCQGYKSGKSNHAEPMTGHSYVLSPDALRSGACRVRPHIPWLARLRGVPVRLVVRLERLDAAADSSRLVGPDEEFTITSAQSEHVIRAPSSFGDTARLRLSVASRPGKFMLMSDAASREPRFSSDASGGDVRRELGHIIMHTAPLCGGWRLDKVDGGLSCPRVYLTFEAMGPSFSIVRVPWREKAILSTEIASGIAGAMAFDWYDPVRQKPFPLSFQVGAMVQQLTRSKMGYTTFLGIAPTFPVLRSDSTMASVGALIGGGVTYITDSSGPDEGFKPILFAGLAVTVNWTAVSVAVGSGSR